MKPDKQLCLSAWLICGILCFIWGNSLLPREVSSAFSQWVQRVLVRLLSGGLPEGEQTGNGLLRKFAHFLEFAALGAALGWRFRLLGKKKIMALAYGVGAACVDETIQFFVPGRGPGLKDVGIDTLGILAGMILFLLAHSVIRRYQQSKENERL